MTTQVLCRVLLGVVWLSLGIAKSVHPERFLAYVERNVARVPALGWGMILAEVLLGGLTLLSVRSRWHRPIAAASLSASLVMTLYLLLGADAEQTCGCFGRVTQATPARRAIVLGAILFLAAQVLREGREERDFAAGRDRSE